MPGRQSYARPSAAGEQFTRTRHGAGGSATGAADDELAANKKARFDIRNPSALAPDAPEEDAVLDIDEIGKRGQQTKRNAVNIDGYESDSSNEGFDGRADNLARAKAEMNKSKNKTDGDDADMFADLADDDDAEDGQAADNIGDGRVEQKRRKREVRFLDHIDGQVLGSKSGGTVSGDFSTKSTPAPSLKGKERSSLPTQSFTESANSDSDESDIDDAIRADVGTTDKEIGAGGKKTHAPLLDAFNMVGEQTEGQFDEQGNFLRKATDPDAKHDSWLEGVSKKDIKRAKEAAEKREEEIRAQRLESDRILTSDILSSLIAYLEVGETVLEALARLAKPKTPHKRKTKASSLRTQKSQMDIDTDIDGENKLDSAVVEAERNRKQAVEGITVAADRLLSRGQTDIYDAERESLQRQYTRETGEVWQDPRADKVEDEWEYRWVDGRDGVEAHGPYDAATMAAWNTAGYFGEGVEFRRKDGATWSVDAGFV